MSYLYLKRPGQLPWGYKPCRLDPQLIEPIPEQLDALRKALEYCEGSSYREVAKWLTAVTGRSISNVALLKIKREDFDKRYPSTPSPENSDTTPAYRPDKKQSGRPKGSEDSYKAKLSRRRKAAERKRAQAKTGSEGGKRPGRPPKPRPIPRSPKRTLRERRLNPYPNNL